MKTTGGSKVYNLQWTAYSKNDYEELDRSQKILVDKSLNRIRDIGMLAGQPCVGKLIGCRRIKHLKAGLRVIFRESSNSIEVIQIVAIGYRDKKSFYDTATKRISDKDKN